MFAPLVIGPLTWLVTRPIGGATAQLVREGARVAVRRVASTAAPVIATVGFSALMAGTYATLHAFDMTEESRALPTGVVVVADGVPGLSDAVPGASESTLETRVYAAGHEPLEATSGDQPVDTIAVAGSEAANLGWVTGTEATVGFADGRSETLKVVVLVDEVVPDDVIVARSVIRAHDPSALSGLIPLTGAPPDSTVLAGLGARAVSAVDYVNAESANDWAIVRLVFTLIVGLAVGYTAIAIANTLLMATVDRRRDFAVLRMSGATVGQVLRVVAAEAVLVVGIGSLLGLVVAVIPLTGVVSGLRHYIPETSMVLPVPAVAAVVGACLALALAASLLPARLALRAPATSLTPAAD
jgi:putative ABC transport system permease protein